MNNPSLSSLISTQHSLELEAHVSVDDAIAKVYEETYELSRALEAWNPEEIQKEARDVLVNILSVSSRYVDIDSLVGEKSESSISEIPHLVATWGRETASIRNRYSRQSISMDNYAITVWNIISSLALLVWSDLESAIWDSLHKFHSRLSEYKKPIDLGKYIRNYPDFPKPGILFKDISPLLTDYDAMRYVAFEFAKHVQDADIIAWLDARWFLFGTLVAQILGKPFVMIRKTGKLPGPTIDESYDLEYGSNSVSIQEDAIKPGQKVAIIDDLLATGGTMQAAANLVEKVWASVDSILCLISLDEPFLLGQAARKSLESKYRVISILHYD